MNEFKAAIVEHLTWKVMFEETVRQGRADFEIGAVADDRQCALGRWLHHHSPRPAANPVALQMLQEVHAEFHGAAASVLVLAQAGRVREAAVAMSPGSHYGEWSSTLVTALERYADVTARETAG